MKSNLRSLIIVLVILLPNLLFSQAKVGTVGLTFLKMDVSAKANAMAGAYIGKANDATALFYNPGGLINLNTPDFIASHNMYVADVKFSYAGYAAPLKAMNAAWGVQASYLTTGKMKITNPNYPTGTGEEFEAYDMMLGLTYAQMLTPKFFVGGTLKYVYESLAPEHDGLDAMNDWTVAADVGTYYDTQWKSLVFGMSIRNFGGTMEYIREEVQLPMIFQFGVAFNPVDDGVNRLSTLIEWGHPADNNEYVLLGLEYSYQDMFFIRGGRKIDENENWFTTDEMNSNTFVPESMNDDTGDFSDNKFNWSGTTAGVGFKVYGFSVDYSFEHMGYLDTQHMISVGYSLR